MELIMVIGFFSLVSTVCMQLFSAASRTSTQSVRLNHAVRASESLTEAWIAVDGDLTRLKELYPGCTLRSDDPADPRTGTLVICYDEDWHRITEAADTAAYTVTIESSMSDAAELYGPETAGAEAIRASVTAMASDGTSICSFTPDHYLGGAQ